MKNRRMALMISILSAIALFFTLGCAQRSAQAPRAASVAPEGPKITVKGKIDYWKNLNDYVVIGPRTYFIVNQDRKLLEELFKSGKTITIEGRRTMGADYLFIETIDGQAYQGKD